MEQPRETLPLFNDAAQAVEAMRAAAKAGAWLQYRRPGTRKVASVDITSCNAAARVWDALSEKSRARLQDITNGDPMHLAAIAWKTLGRAAA